MISNSLVFFKYIMKTSVDIDHLMQYVIVRLKWNICVVPVAYLPYFFKPTLNIKMVFGEKIPKKGHFFRFCHYIVC